MDKEIEQLSKSLNLITLNENIKIINIIKIQKVFRGYIYRLKHLPLIMYKIQKYLKLQMFIFSYKNKDGRLNSCIDEDDIIKILIKKFDDRIKIPKIRMWYDILAYDYIHGWIPINIKTTTTLTNDNVGNLTMCVYSYTDTDNKIIDILYNKSYDNNKMSHILFEKLKNNKYNKNNKKDYYFLVLNKNNNTDIIINSIKGLTKLTPNLNNLPFQICWNKNKEFKYTNIKNSIKLFIECLKKPKINWKEIFLSNIRTL